MRTFGAHALWLVSVVSLPVGVGCGSDAQKVDGGEAGFGGSGVVTPLGGASGSAVVSGGASMGGASAMGGAGASGTAGGGVAGAASAPRGAPELKPTGYSQATTGGGSKAVIVASMAAMSSAIDAYSGCGGLVLQCSGKFDFSTIKDRSVQHTLPAQTVEIKMKFASWVTRTTSSFGT